ncbi:MAG: tRNA threonylcarbamoyladenosine biosynthesis protein TsaE [Clostridia bacterium]|nr:tRNA threonylcarbamoyladenosine biosynthesis protein TsaE [Clostridia bacterium]
MRVFLPDAAATRALGRALANHLKPGDVLVLKGELGMGKTTLVQGLAAGLGVDGPVTSPTFTLVQEYQGRYPFYHIDLYRLDEEEELEALGLEEYICGMGIVAIEWGDKFPAVLPPERLEIALSQFGAGREARLLPLGGRFKEMVAELKRDARFGP